jgi:predicted dehydrogenase
MGKTYRAAIIGVGAIADIHALAMGELENLELVAGSCRTEAKGQAFADRFGCRWYRDYEELLDEARPDFVTIATPSGFHLEPLEACARRGIHVLCEKPLEISVRRVDRMIQVARESGIRLGGIFPQRFNPVLRVVHGAAAQRRFGDLAVVNAYVPWWRDDAYYAPDRWQGTLDLDGGGAMMNQSIHGVDAAQWLASAAIPDLPPGGNPVREIFAFTAKRGHDPDLIEVEDTAVAVLRLRGGALGQILGATSMFPGSLKRLQLAGRGGTAEVLEDELVTWAFDEEQAGDEGLRRRFSEETRSGGGAADPMAIDYSLHTGNIGGFVDWLEGDDSFLLDGPESRKAVAIIEAIYESARTGRIAAVES